MTTGEMKQVLVLKIPAKSGDTTGGQSENYPTLITTRGLIKFRKGLRNFQTGFDEDIKVYDGWIPWRKDIEANITKDMRVGFESREFKIVFFRLINETRKIYQLELNEVT